MADIAKQTLADTATIAAEELSEEDRKLKEELEMLVERIQVSTTRLTLIIAAKTRTGTRRRPAEVRSRDDQRFNQDFHIINDSSTKTSKVSEAAL